MTPYKSMPLVKASLLQRLFKQQPPENAIIELNNLLAEKDPEDLTAADLQNIETHYQLSLDKEFPLNLQEFYAVFWNESLKAPENTNTEATLGHLAELFRLSSDTVNQLHHKIGADWYRKAAAGALTKRRLSTEDKVNLDYIRQRLKLEQTPAKQILDEEKNRALDTFTTALVKRNRATPEEIKEFDEIRQSLKIDPARTAAISQTLNTLHLYWRLEHLRLQPITTTMTLQKSETCYYQVNQVKWQETRNDRRGTAHYQLISTGSLCLTNKRLLFESYQKNTNIPYERIKHIEHQSIGILIQKDKGKDPLLDFNGDKTILEILLKRITKEFKGFEIR